MSATRWTEREFIALLLGIVRLEAVPAEERLRLAALVTQNNAHQRQWSILHVVQSHLDDLSCLLAYLTTAQRLLDQGTYFDWSYETKTAKHGRASAGVGVGR